MQIKLFKVKKKKKILYEAYKNEKEKEVLMNDQKLRLEKKAEEKKEKQTKKDKEKQQKNDIKEMPVKEKPVKEKPVKEKPVKEKPVKEKPIEKVVKEKAAKDVNPEITITIAIASLEEKCGCSYITKAIAKYIKNEIDPNVCIVNIPGAKDPDDNEFLTYESVDICNLYDNFHYIIIDLGNLKNLGENEINEFKRANKKIMIAKINDPYLQKINEYIKEDKKSVKKWTFLFNFVAPDLKKIVDERMENYEHYCLELFNKDNPDKNTIKIFQSIFNRKRRV